MTQASEEQPPGLRLRQLQCGSGGERRQARQLQHVQLQIGAPSAKFPRARSSITEWKSEEAG